MISKLLTQSLTPYVISIFLLSFISIDLTVFKGELSRILPYAFVYSVIFLLGLHMNLRIDKNRWPSPTFLRNFSIALLVIYLGKGYVNHVIMELINVYGNGTVLYLYFSAKTFAKVFFTGSFFLMLPAIYSFAVSEIKPLLPESFDSPEYLNRGYVNSRIVFYFVFLVFIALRLYLIFKYSGNYPDDWLHIVSGLEFIETGKLPVLNNYFEGNGYLRGSYVSYAVGYFSMVVGRNLDLLQLLPLAIGSLNFLLFNNILRKIVKNDWVRYLVLFLYSILPFTAFIHIYIRMYVFYEFFILIGQTAFIKALHFLRKREFLKSTLIVVLGLILSILIYNSSYDNGVLIVFFVLGVMVLYTFIFELDDKFPLRIENKTLASLVNVSSTKKLTFIFVLLLPIFIYGFKILQISTNPGSVGAGFTSYLYRNFYLLFPFILFSLLSIQEEKNVIRKIFVITGIAVLVLLNILPADLNLIRVLVVTTSLLLIPVGIGIDNVALLKLREKFRNLLPAVLTFLFIMLGFSSYPGYYFTSGPGIPGEIGYNDYAKIMDYASGLEDRVFIYSTYNVNAQKYWDMDRGYVINIDNVVTGQYFPEGIHLIDDLEELDYVISSNNVCIFMMNFSKELLLNEATSDYIDKNFVKVIEGSGVYLVCEREENTWE